MPPKTPATAPKRPPRTAPPKKKAATAARKKKNAPESVPTPKAKTPDSQPSWRRQARRLLKGAAIATAILLATSILWTLAYRWINPPGTLLMIARHYFEEMPIQKEWRDFDQISPKLALAIIAAEDQRFPEHFGMDLTELRNALDGGGRLRGASTITQQTAKNVFLWNERSWIRKGLEVYFTLLVELLWGKRRILEVYMNVVEMGPGIYGAEAAAQHYFHKSAQELTGKEAAAIAAILPNPLKRSILNPSAEVQRKKEWILHQMNNLGGTEYLNKIS